MSSATSAANAAAARGTVWPGRVTSRPCGDAGRRTIAAIGLGASLWLGIQHLHVL